MLSRPEFVMARTADIARVGPLGADILALVRYATNPDMPHTHDAEAGVLWWRASYEEIGDALGGVDKNIIGRAVRALERNGELVSQQTSDSDQRKRYRRPHEQSECDSASVLSSQNANPHDDPCETDAESQETDAISDRTDADSHQYQHGSAFSSTYKELPEIEEQGERAHARKRAHTPPSIDSNSKPHGKIDETRDPEPPKHCQDHHPNGTGTPCKNCKIARLNHKEWQDRRTMRSFRRLGLSGLAKPEQSAGAVTAEGQRRQQMQSLEQRYPEQFSAQETGDA